MGMITGLAEIVILVDDEPRATAFYGGVLGLTVFSPAHLPGVFLRVGEPGDGVPQQVVLVPRPAGVEAAGRPRGALHHIGLQVAAGNFAAMRARLESMGHATRDGQHPFLAVDAFYVDDPDGNEVEIVSARA